MAQDNISQKETSTPSRQKGIFVEHTVEDLLFFRGRKTALVTVSQHAMVITALKKMACPEIELASIGSILVTKSSKDPTPIGILTERDILVDLEVKGRSARNTRVKTIMRPCFLPIDIKQSLIKAMETMICGHYKVGTFRYFPVTQDGKVVTIISERDLLMAIDQFGYVDIHRHKHGLI